MLAWTSPDPYSLDLQTSIWLVPCRPDIVFRCDTLCKWWKGVNFMFSGKSWLIFRRYRCRTTWSSSPWTSCQYLHHERRTAGTEKESFTTKLYALPSRQTQMWQRATMLSVCEERSTGALSDSSCSNQEKASCRYAETFETARKHGQRYHDYSRRAVYEGDIWLPFDTLAGCSTWSNDVSKDSWTCQ